MYNYAQKISLGAMGDQSSHWGGVLFPCRHWNHPDRMEATCTAATYETTADSYLQADYAK